MGISIGIVGLPNTGKSTLFNALTRKQVPAENFPFCTIDPSVGVVAVPDERLKKLEELSKSKETIPSVVEFVDIAGLVKGAADGEGLGNAFLSHIRDVDAIAHMVRGFEHKDILHVEGEPNPMRDIRIIETELILADVGTIEKRLEKITKEVRQNNKEALKEKEILEKALAILNKGEISKDWNQEERKTLKTLLTMKPMMLVINGLGGKKDENITKEVEGYAREKNIQLVHIDAKTEDDLKDLGDSPDIRSELQVTTEGVDALIQQAYKLLNLITFFTTGEKETRAWAIQKGSTAKKAGAAIHTDFETNFIRAEVVGFEDFISCGGYAKARADGKARVEGKEYVVEDGDILVFRI